MSIGWSALETFSGSVASTSTASSGDDWFRSFTSSLALGLSPSFNWPGSGSGSTVSAGESQLGNARCAVAGNSAVTGGYGDGFLLLNTNHISLHHIGSTNTFLVGHSSMVDYGAAAGQRSLQTGVFSLVSLSDGSFGTKTVAFAPVFAATPTFFQLEAGNAGYAVSLSTLTAGGFSAVYSGLRPTMSNVSVFWESDGTW